MSDAPNPSPAAKSGEALRDVDETDIAGWAVFMGHAIPTKVARFIAAQISGRSSAALATPSPQPADAVREALEERNDAVAAWKEMTKWFKSEQRRAEVAIEKNEKLMLLLRRLRKSHGPFTATDIVDFDAALTEPAPATIGSPATEEEWQDRNGLSSDETSEPAPAGEAVEPAMFPNLEDTAHLREDLERVTRERDFYRNSLAEEIKNRDEALEQIVANIAAIERGKEFVVKSVGLVRAANKRVERMHRRAQKAEGCVGRMETWIKFFEERGQEHRRNGVHMRAGMFDFYLREVTRQLRRFRPLPIEPKETDQ